LKGASTDVTYPPIFETIIAHMEAVLNASTLSKALRSVAVPAAV
jgi:hypothetical protein